MYNAAQKAEHAATAATLTNLSAAVAVRDAAEAEQISSREFWNAPKQQAEWGAKECADAIEFADRDAERLFGIASDIAEGNPAGALRYASQSDTAIREAIPAPVWLFIGGELL